MGLLVLWHPGQSCCSSVPSFSRFAGLCCCLFTIPGPFGPWVFLLWQIIFLYPLCSPTSATLHARILCSIHECMFWDTVKQQNASFSLACDCFPSEMNSFKPKYFTKHECCPSLILTASLCCCKVQQSFWWTQHAISEPYCTSALHTHTQNSWVLAVNLQSISWFNGVVCSVQRRVRLPKARNGIRNVVLGGWFLENP